MTDRKISDILCLMFNGQRIEFQIISVHKITLPASLRAVTPKPHAVLSFRLTGNAEMGCNGKRVTLGKNDVTFVPSQTAYTISSDEEDLIVVHLIGERLSTLPLQVFHPTQPEIFERLFEKLLYTWNTKPLGHVYSTDALLLSILENAEIQEKSQTANPLSVSIRKAIDYMHAEFANPELTIMKIAQKTGYCPSHFRRVFHVYTRLSPQDYLIKLRMDHANELLESGYYSVEETARLCGFDDAKYFSTAYKKRYGVPPSDKLPRHLHY